MNILVILGLIFCLVLGLMGGGAYFWLMWWTAELFAIGDHVAPAVALVAGRFALIVAVLATVAIRGGALPLVATGLGIAVARTIAMRRVKAMVP